MRENTYLHEMIRKLFIVFAVLAGLFAFQGTLADEPPKEKARIELVARFEQRETVSRSTATIQVASHFLTPAALLRSQVAHPRLHYLLVASQHHHSSL
jgi:hypothetical protein